jgi:MYXO-CTERM domain-containing protein
VTASKCLDEHTAVDAFGTETKCNFYLCENGACRSDCLEVGQYASPAVCNSDHQCKLPEAAAADESVCACRAPGGSHSRPTPAWLLSGLVLLFALRRRAR